MSLKAKLLTPVSIPTKDVEVLGGSFPAQRLSTSALNVYDKAQRACRENMDGEGLNRSAAQFVLDSLVDEDGKPMGDSVTPDELMDIHVPTVINAAAQKLVQLNYASLEGAEEAKKD